MADKDPEKGFRWWFKLFLKQQWIALAISTAGISLSFTILTFSKAFSGQFLDILGWMGIVIFVLMSFCWVASALILIVRNWREPPPPPKKTPERAPNGRFVEQRKGQPIPNPGSSKDPESQPAVPP